MEAQNTRENILEAAKSVFFKKGISGARMQEIANLAGINKAMVHYYFTSKEQLFNVIFEKALGVFVGRIVQLLNSDEPLEEKVANYVDHTIESLKANPGITLFVMNELNTNPDRITQIFAGEGQIDLSVFKRQVSQRMNNEIAPEMLFLDMVAMCVYPFIAQRIFKALMTMDDIAFGQFMDERKIWIKKQILSNL